MSNNSAFDGIFRDEIIATTNIYKHEINVERLTVGGYILEFVEEYGNTQRFAVYDEETEEELYWVRGSGCNLDMYGLLNYIPKWCGDLWEFVNQDSPWVATYFKDYLLNRDKFPITFDNNGAMFYKGTLVETFVEDGSVRWRAPNLYLSFYKTHGKPFDSLQELCAVIDNPWIGESETDEEE